jgi:hypothetical protein
MLKFPKSSNGSVIFTLIGPIERRADSGAEGAITTEAPGRSIILDLKDLTDGNGFRSDVDAWGKVRGV